jgi:hypothetical protein
MTSRSRARAIPPAVALLVAAVLALGAVAPAAATRAPSAAPPRSSAVPPAAWQPVTGSAESADDVRMAPGTNGRLFVAIRRAGGTLVSGFSARGRLLAGWPVILTGWSDCWIGAVAVDSSVRLVCHNRSEAVRAFAFTAGGRRLAGWPVNVSTAAGSRFTDYDHFTNTGDEPRIVGGRLFILLQRWDGDQALRLVRISAAARVTVGRQFPLTAGADWWGRALGADGTGFAVRSTGSGSSTRTTIIAFGLAGARTGWPVRIDGSASLPVVGPHGRVFVVRAADSGGVAWVRAFERNGSRVAGWSPRLAVVPTSDWNGAGPFHPAPPVVAATGSAWLVGARTAAGGTVAWALGPAGSVRSGWPYRSAAGVSECGAPGGCCTGCGYLRAAPAVGPGNVLYLAQDPRSTSIGGRIVAIGSGGNVRSGWPVTLARPASRFRSVVVAPSGSVYGLAIEPERTVTEDGCRGVVKSSATIVAIAPDGTVRYRRTVMNP